MPFRFLFARFPNNLSNFERCRPYSLPKSDVSQLEQGQDPLGGGGINETEVFPSLTEIYLKYPRDMESLTKLALEAHDRAMEKLHELWRKQDTG